jgi:hypothetical protein
VENLITKTKTDVFDGGWQVIRRPPPRLRPIRRPVAHHGQPYQHFPSEYNQTKSSVSQYHPRNQILTMLRQNVISSDVDQRVQLRSKSVPILDETRPLISSSDRVKNSTTPIGI